MRKGDRALGLAQDTGPRVALRQVDGLGEGLAQQARALCRYRAGTPKGRTP